MFSLWMEAQTKQVLPWTITKMASWQKVSLVGELLCLIWFTIRHTKLYKKREKKDLGRAQSRIKQRKKIHTLKKMNKIMCVCIYVCLSVYFKDKLVDHAGLTLNFEL